VIGLLTCLVLVVTTGLSAEAVRAGCRRRLMTPLPIRHERPAQPVRELELTGAAER
jgi:hypothetical protein